MDIMIVYCMKKPRYAGTIQVGGIAVIVAMQHFLAIQAFKGAIDAKYAKSN